MRDASNDVLAAAQKLYRSASTYALIILALVVVALEYSVKAAIVVGGFLFSVVAAVLVSLKVVLIVEEVSRGEGFRTALDEHTTPLSLVCYAGSAIAVVLLVWFVFDSHVNMIIGMIVGVWTGFIVLMRLFDSS